MNSFKYIFIFTIVSFLLCIPFETIKAQEKKNYSKEIKEQIQQVENNLALWIQIENTKPKKWSLQDRMQFHHVNAVSIAVIKNYKIEWAKAYGYADIMEKRLATTSTLFQAASISKSLNAVGVLKLVQQKKLDLQTDINTYLKSWQFPYDSVSKGKKINTANLLSHTAGTTVHGFGGYAVGQAIPSLIEILEGKNPANSDPIRSEFEPGLKYQYSGGGTTISQLMVEDITGKQYADYMKNKVLKPMGMTESFYGQPQNNQQNKVATGYYLSGEVKGKYHIYPEQAAAALWTNPIELSKYIIETQLALQGKSQKVLSKAMTSLRLTPYIDKNAALGVFIDDKNGVKYFAHNGSNEGFMCNYIGSLKDGNGMVVMTNGENPSIINEIINSVADTYHWKEYYVPIIKKEITLPDAVLNTFVGEYKASNWTYKIIKKEDGIWLDNGMGVKKIHFSDATHFFFMERKEDFNFLTDETGKINAFSISDGRIAKKV